MFQISHFAKNAAFIIAVTIASLSLSYIARAVWSEPGNIPPTCPAGSPGCDAPINVSDIEQAKIGGLRLGITGTAVSDGEFAAYLFKDANNPNYFIDPANAGISAILNGNVGIGTSSPDSKLEVSGGVGSANLKITADTDNVNEADQPSLTFSQDGGGITGQLGFFDGSNALTLKNVFNDKLHLGTNNIDQLTILGDGNVGIGTIDPGAKLEVAGQVKITGGTPGANKVLTSDVSGLASWQSIAGTLPGGVLGQTLRHDGTTWIVSNNIYNNGNVGIGTTTPDYKLDVNGSLKATNYVWKDGVNWSMPDANSEMSFDFASGDGTAYWQVWDPVHGSIIAARNTGNVGIGVTNPGAELEIRSSGSSPSSNGLYVYNTSNLAGEDSFLTARVGGSSAGDPMLSFDIAGEDGWSAGIDNSDFNKFKIGRDWDSLSANTALTIDSGSGDVGIGTTGPAIKLAIGDSDTGLNWAGDGQLDLYSNNVNTLNVRSGNVGVGKTNPGDKLDVKGQVRLTATDDNNAYATIYADKGASGETLLDIDPITSANTLSSQVRLFRDVNTAGSVGLRIYKGDGLATSNHFLSGNGNSYLAANNGNVGIGTSGPGEKLDVNGNVRADAFFYSSDERLKENIARIESPLAKILKLDGVAFNWKKSGGKSVGLTAQNVEKVFPELVKSDSAGIKSVEYGNLVAPLIEAIKEQQKMIESQQRQIDELKALIK